MTDDQHCPTSIHDCPRDGEAVTLCCGKSPLELSRCDRLTLDSALVTCNRQGATT